MDESGHSSYFHESAERSVIERIVRFGSAFRRRLRFCRSCSASYFGFESQLDWNDHTAACFEQDDGGYVAGGCEEAIGESIEFGRHGCFVCDGELTVVIFQYYCKREREGCVDGRSSCIECWEEGGSEASETSQIEGQWYVVVFLSLIVSCRSLIGLTLFLAIDRSLKKSELDGAAFDSSSVFAAHTTATLADGTNSFMANSSHHLPSTLAGSYAPGGVDPRRTSHKAAEQKRRDSLKLCFEELRQILPPLAQAINEEDRRPGEGNVGGQRGGSVDPENPNKGVSKVALLRRSNEYVGILDDRIERRDRAIEALRFALMELRTRSGESGGDGVDGFDLDQLDKGEKMAGTMAYYENWETGDDGEDGGELPLKVKAPRKPTTKKKANHSGNNGDGDFTPSGQGKANGARRSSRRPTTAANAMTSTEEDFDAMDVEV